jgi:hypothetical protein
MQSNALATSHLENTDAIFFTGSLRAEGFGDVSTARRAYKRALRLAPDDSATLCNFAEMLRGR